jgi:hypothetical protein
MFITHQKLGLVEKVEIAKMQYSLIVAKHSNAEETFCNLQTECAAIDSR